MKVICISGKARHGKDTAAGIMKAMLEADGYKVLVAHYAGLVKYICRAFFGWNGEKDEYGRSLLQRVGTDVIRRQKPDYWVSFVADILGFFQDEWDYVLIPDCRFPNEVGYLKERGLDAVHVRVTRENFVSPLTPEQQRHPSETALDTVAPDYRIVNSGTLSDLRDAVSKLLTEINGYHQLSFAELSCGEIISGTLDSALIHKWEVKQEF